MITYISCTMKAILSCTMKAARAALTAALLAALAVSCSTIQTDVRYETPQGSTPDELVSIERALVAQRLEPNAVSLAADRARLSALVQTPGSDPVFKARLLALEADAALVAGEKALAAKKAAEALIAYAGDELAVLVQARLAKTPADARAILEKALDLSDGSYRLRAELGSTLAREGRYREAVAAFDASLPFLPPEYGRLHAAERDRSWALRDSDSAPSKGSARYLDSEELPFIGMVALAASETGALDWLTGGAPWDSGALFERLKAAGWFADPGARGDTVGTRKDAALFLWSLMARTDARMRARYTEHYAAKKQSPIPDLPYSSPYFDGVMGSVEEGIMELVDGRSFMPDSAISGLDFWAWLKAAAAWK